MDRLLTFSLRYRFFTLVAIAVVIAAGLWSFAHLTIDAVPDLTPVQVQVLTKAPALGPVEVEQFITFPIEASLSGLPALRELRSVSRYGLSAVTAIFEDNTDIYRARQLVTERLARAMEKIPAEYGRPAIGPLTTGLGEVYQFTLKGPRLQPDGAADDARMGYRHEAACRARRRRGEHLGRRAATVSGEWSIRPNCCRSSSRFGRYLMHCSGTTPWPEAAILSGNANNCSFAAKPWRRRSQT